jgi:hypothetical protein
MSTWQPAALGMVVTRAAVGGWRVRAQGLAGQDTAEARLRRWGVAPRRSTAGLPVKGAALRCASLRDSPGGLPSDREPRRPRCRRRTAAGRKRPAAPRGWADTPKPGSTTT